MTLVREIVVEELEPQTGSPPLVEAVAGAVGHATVAEQVNESGLTPLATTFEGSQPVASDTAEPSCSGQPNSAENKESLTSEATNLSLAKIARMRRLGALSQRRSPASQPAGKRNRRSKANPDDIVGLYLDDITKYPLLTEEQKVALALAVKAGRQARDVLNNGSENGETLTEARTRLLRRDVSLGKAAKEEFVMGNLRLVVSVAKNYGWAPLSFSDIVQEGNLGLMHAVDKFDHTKGFKFSTYATYWINQSIQRGIVAGGHNIRLPAGVLRDQWTIINCTNELKHKLGRSPKFEEVVTSTQLGEERVIFVTSLLDPKYLSEPAHSDGEDSNVEIGDLLVDDQTKSPEDIAAQLTLPKKLADLLDRLGVDERQVVRLCSGLDTGLHCSYEEAARTLGISNERVSRLYRAAVDKLVKITEVETALKELSEFIS